MYHSLPLYFGDESNGLSLQSLEKNSEAALLEMERLVLQGLQYGFLIDHLVPEKLLVFHLLGEAHFYGRVDLALTPPIRYLYPNQVSERFPYLVLHREFEERGVWSQTGALIYLRF